MTTRATTPDNASYAYELVISAVGFDSMLVAELSERLAPRLRVPAFWTGADPAALPPEASAMVAGTSRLVLVLHQRLWAHEATTRADDALLRERLRARRKSVYVVTLDDAPVAECLGNAARCNFIEVGLDRTVDFILDALIAAGGTPRAQPVATDAAEPAVRRWPEGPPPFLNQPRAQSALRRELDVLAAALAPASRTDEPRGAHRLSDVQALPNRLVARYGEIGISFSWIAGQSGTVGDGRLLVIEWRGVVPERNGVNSLKSAVAVRERVYRVEGTGPDAWRWRLDSPNGRACSTVNLAAEWMASASLEATA